MDRPSRPGRLRHSSTRWLPTVAIAIPLLLLVVPNVSAFARLTPAYTAGCQGVPTGTKIFSQSGTTSGGIYTYSDKTGKSHGSEAASSKGSPSAIYAGAYYFVGPPSSGCTYPSKSIGHTNATWTWRLTVTPYLAANCSSDRSTGNATLSVFILGNIHTFIAPYYVFSTHKTSYPLPLSVTVACAGASSSIYNPGRLAAVTVVLKTGTFVLPANNWGFDFYTSVYANATATASSGATAYSAVTLSAHLLSVSCPRCP